MKVYKVVSVSCWGLHSMCYVGLRHQLTYKVGEWTYPRIGNIFAFDTLKNAKHFAMSTEQIWLAEAEACFRPGKVLSNLTWGALEAFWGPCVIHPADLQDAPEGTLLTPRIMLLEWVGGRIP
jgi:hypothetical protein